MDIIQRLNPDSYDLYELVTAEGRVRFRFTTFGAHVLDWYPLDMERSVFWNSSMKYTQHQPIRGGVPICLPWFAQRIGYVNHGMVRTKTWELTDATIGKKQCTILLTYHHDKEDEAWPHAFDSTLTIVVNESLLQMKLTYKNLTDREVAIAGAFHNYFSVSDVNNVRVDNVAQTRFFNKITKEFVEGENAGLNFTTMIDRIYYNNSTLLIQDTSFQHTLELDKKHMNQWVVWNPGENCDQFEDIEPGHHKEFICIEPAQVDLVNVASLTTHDFIQGIAIK